MMNSKSFHNMKRIALLLVVLLYAASVSAQTASDGTIVYLQTAGFPAEQPTIDAYIDGAFVATGEWRNFTRDRVSINYCFFRLQPDESLDARGGQITFRSNVDGVCYLITDVSGTYRNNAPCARYTELTYYDAETSYGTLSAPVMLTFEAPVFHFIEDPLTLEHVGAEAALTDAFDIDGSQPMMDERWFLTKGDVAEITKDDEGTLVVRANHTGTGYVAVVNPVTGEEIGQFAVEVSAQYFAVEDLTANKEYPFPATMTEGDRVECFRGMVTFVPDYATDQTLVWSTSDESVIALEMGDTNMGPGYYAVAVKEGHATITAASADNPEAKVSFEVDVLPFIHVTDIDVKDGGTVSRYTWYRLDGLASTLPADATSPGVYFYCNPVVSELRWNYDGTIEVMFNADANGDEYVYVGCYDNDALRDSVHFYVHVPVEKIDIRGTFPSHMVPGETLPLDDSIAVVFTPSDATVQTVSWSSSDEEVLAIGTDTGTGRRILTAGKEGSATVQVTADDNAEATLLFPVTVRWSSISAFELHDREVTLDVDVWYRICDFYSVQPADANPNAITVNVMAPTGAPIDSGYELRQDDDGNWCIRFSNDIKSQVALVISSADDPGIRCFLQATINTHVASIGIEGTPYRQIPLGVTRIFASEGYGRYENMDMGFELTYEPRDVQNRKIVVTSSADSIIHVYYNEDWECYMLTTVGLGTTTLTGYSEDNPEAKVQFDIEVIDVRLTAAKGTQQLSVGDYVDYSYTQTPADYDLGYMNISVSDESVLKEAMTMKDGLIFVCLNEGHSMLYIRSYYFPEICDSIDVTVRPELKELVFGDNISEVTAVRGDTVEVLLTSKPDGSFINPEQMRWTISGEGMPEEWGIVDMTITEGYNALILQLVSRAAGRFAIAFEVDNPYADMLRASGTLGVTVNEVMRLDDGWSWISTPQSGMSLSRVEFDKMLGGEVQEIRTQSALVSRDPEYGFFGDLDAFAGSTFYKMYSDKSAVEHTTDSIVFTDITYAPIVQGNHWITLQDGWNWIAYPYQFNHTLDDLGEHDAWRSLPDEAQIVAQDGTFAICTGGTMSGTLTQLEDQRGYLVYTPRPADMLWPAESELEMQPAQEPTPNPFQRKGLAKRRALRVLPFGEDLGEASAAPEIRNSASPFTFDYHRYAEVMTLVAMVDGLPDGSHIGAFVDGECCGWGEQVGARYLVGICGNGPRTITLKAWDEETGTWYDFDHTVSFTDRLGTLSSPARFVAKATTAVDGIPNDDEADAPIYDLQGRRVPPGGALADGIYLMNGKKIYINNK